MEACSKHREGMFMQRQPIIARGPREPYQGKSLFKQRGPITLKTCPSRSAHLPGGLRSDYKASVTGEGATARGSRNMRENLVGVSQKNMAFTDCMKPADLSAENK